MAIDTHDRERWVKGLEYYRSEWEKSKDQ